jgi:hypothetical protein
MENTKTLKNTASLQKERIFEQLLLAIKDEFIATVTQADNDSIIMRFPCGTQYRILLTAL